MPKTKRKTTSGRARTMSQRGREEHEVATRTQNPRITTRQTALRGRRPRDTTTTTLGNHTGELATPLTRADIPELVQQVVLSLAPSQLIANSTQPATGGGSANSGISASTMQETDDTSTPLTRHDIPELVQQVARSLVSASPTENGLLPEDTFMQKYLKAKSDLGTENLKLLKVLFFGPPGAGKSTLLSVLLNQDIRVLRQSTGMLDRKLVQFKVAVQKDAESSISHWKTVDINEEILRLRHTIVKVIEMRDSPKLDLSTCLTTKLKPNMKIDEKLQSVAVDLKSDRKHQTSIVQQNFATSNSLIACYDSGGQPEFFDVMPAFVTATTGNIMIFDMSKNLHSKLDPEFFKNGQHFSLFDAETHYTGAQLLKTALANIQSYATQYTSYSTISRHSRSNRLLVVGTHLDLCGNTEEEICQALRRVEAIICDDVLHDSSGITKIKRSKKKYTNIIHPIANKSHNHNSKTIKNKEEAAQEIRTAIESMCENHSVNNEIPISWLLFQYEIKLHEGPCILRYDCDKIAEQSYIDKKDVDDILFFFHELGILLYYKDVKNLRRVVFSDPQWLFTQLTKLIELKYCASPETKRSIRRGIFKKEFLEEIYGEEFDAKDVLQYEDIFNIFVHLNIMARLSDATEEYFMPALLDPNPNISMKGVFGDQVCSTLYIKFKDGFFPRGVFCCLIASSIQKIKNWRLQLNATYKDVVAFQIEKNKEYLVLSDKIHFISAEIHRKEKLPQNQHHVVCYTLYKNLKEVCDAIHLDGDFKFGFLCENNKEHFASVEMQYPCCPETLSCSDCQHTSVMTYDQLIWFVPPKVLDIKSKSSMALSYDNDDPSSSTKPEKRWKAPQQDVNLSSYHSSLLAQDVQMWELTKIVIPKIMAEWEFLAFCMRYRPEEVEAFRKEQNLKQQCTKLFINWLTTGHGPKPKTYQTLLKHIKEVEELKAVSEVIEKELIEDLHSSNAFR